MGAWGRGTFENDTALDWLYDLESETTLNIIANAFSLGEGYLDSDQACEVLASAEVLLALGGKARVGLPDSAASWVKSNSALDPRPLKAAAANAIMRVLGKDSELDELWSDSDSYAGWKADVEMLLGAIDSL